MTRAQRRRVRMGVQAVIRNNPGIDTRHISTFIAAPGISINKHHINGHLSWLKRSGQIKIVTLQPKRCSIAF